MNKALSRSPGCGSSKTRSSLHLKSVQVSRQALEQGRAVACGEPDAVEFFAQPEQVARGALLIDPRTQVPLGPGWVGEVWMQTQGPGVSLPGQSGVWSPADEHGFWLQDHLFLLADHELLQLSGQQLNPRDIEELVERTHPAILPGASAAFAVEIDGTPHLGLIAKAVRLDGWGIHELLDFVRIKVAGAFQIEVVQLALIAGSHTPQPRRLLQRALENGELEILAQWSARPY